MKKILLTIIFYGLLLNFNMAFAQISQIKGTVIDSNNKPLDYYTVAILTSSDSSMIKGGAFVDGYFEFSNIKLDKCFLQISCVGYQTVKRPINFSENSSIDIGTVQMKTLELDEVIIRAKRPVFKQVEGRLIIDVKGTSLSQAGDLFDALKRSPGLIVDNDNNITVFGKGTPIVFINNREVQNKAEIESLQSDDIVSIEIDRNPSAEYSASGNAVVRIRTKKITKDQISLQLYNRSYFARKYRNSNGIQLGSKVGNTTSSVNYSNGNYKYKNYEDSYEINHQDNYTIDNRNKSIRQSKTLKHNLFASVNQKINEKNNIGFQYSYISNNRDQKSNANQRINQTNEDETERNIIKNKNTNNDLQTYNLNYEFNIDSVRSLSLIGDYSKVTNKSSEDIDEHNITDSSALKTLINNKNDYNVYSGKVDYKTPIFKSVKLQSGVKIARVKNDGTAISTDRNSNFENYKIEDQIDDRILAAYFMLKNTIKSLNLKGGLRYEYTDTDIRSDGITVLDSTYGNWFPSILINMEFSDHIDATLSYAKKINRPTFDELSTNITYFDSLSYSIGNPAIKPTISHNIDLSFGLFNNLSVNFAYKYEKNARILSAVSDDVNPDIVKYTPVNIDQAEYMYMNIDYNYSGKNLNSTFSFGGKKPFIEIPYMDALRKIRKSSWYFQTNNDYSITPRTSIFANYLYGSSSKDLMTHFESRSKLSLGLNTSFFEKKLRVSLMVNDILNSSDNAWEDRYGNIVAGLDPDYDNTWVRISIKYNFNNFKRGIQKKSASDSELNRL